MIKPEIKKFLHEGTVIPAHPLALNAERRLDEKRQRRLTRYYMACQAGGVAVGVHTTQFEIRDAKVALYERVLALAAEEVAAASLTRPFLKVAGIVGPTAQALAEAKTAAGLGYDLGLLSMGGLKDWTEEQILERAKAVAEIIPIFGFYLQPSVGGRIFTYDFWLEFAKISNVHAIKVAAFNRYQTLDVVRAVCFSGRHDDIALYTGNDDNIVGIKQCKARGNRQTSDLLTKGIAITDMNAAIFDPAHDFHGCIPGIHEVLRRQGLLEGTWCLNPHEDLSPGQTEEIDRVCKAYPALTDEHFVKSFLEQNSFAQTQN